MWKFEDYLKEHKIALLNVGACLAARYENIDWYPLYRQLNRRLDKNLFKLWEHLPQSFKRKSSHNRWYGEWQDSIDDYNVIIIGNDLRGRDLIEYIRARNPEARIIVHLSSLIGAKNRKDPRRYEGLGVEFWTFDKGDSERWGIGWCPFFYDTLMDPWEEIIKENEKCEPEYDVFFIGTAFDRAEKLIKMHDIFQAQGIHDKLVIVKTYHTTFSEEISKYLTESRMTYDEVVNAVRKCRCILEIVQGGQKGISLRPMEAATFQKKLITDNKNTVNYSLYTHDNVFILGVDPIEKLKEFVYSPYVPIPSERLTEYKPQYWLEKLLEGKK